MNRSAPQYHIGKLALFIVTLLLFVTAAAGYVYAKTPQETPSGTANEEQEREQTYYKKLTYAANEMHNQLERWKKQPDAAEAGKGKAYVDGLMAALQDPPEELIVAQTIVEQLYAAYAASYQSVVNGEELDSGPFDAHYEDFLTNAILIQNFSQYKGLNVICH